MIEIRHSEQTANLFAALVRAQAVFESAATDSYNVYHRSKYADLASVVEATRHGMAANGLAIVQFPSTTTAEIKRSVKDADGVARFTDDGTPLLETVPVANVVILTRLVHESGEWIENELSIPAVLGKTPAQVIGSTITYGRRYARMAILGIAAEDDDGNVASNIDGPTTSRDLPPTQPRQQAQPAHQQQQAPAVQTRRQEAAPARPRGHAEIVQAHIDRLTTATSINTLRHLYEAAFGELNGKVSPELMNQLDKAKDSVKQRLNAATAQPVADEYAQALPEYEDAPETNFFGEG